MTAGNGKLGTFGSFAKMIVFEVTTDKQRTWHNLTKKSAANFAAQARLLQKPTQEFLGLEATEFSLALRFDVQMGLNPSNELANVHDLLDGNPYPLILNHKPQGYFVLTSIEETWLYTDGAGRLLVAEVQIQLSESNRNVN